MAQVWNWLVSEGLYHFVVGWLVGLVMTGMLVPFVRRVWGRRHDELRHIADLLNVETRGGLHDLKRTLDEILKLIEVVSPPFDWERAGHLEDELSADQVRRKVTFDRFVHKSR